MASIALDVETLQARLPEGLSIAAVNGPRSTVVAGEDAALDALLAELSAEDVWVRRIPVDYPSHSAAVELLQDRLLADLGPIAPVSSEIPFYSTLEGGLIDTAALDARYWYRNLREPVQFAPTLERVLADGAGLFVEPTPHPVLTGAVADTIEQAGGAAAAIGTLRRDDGGLERFTFALANAHVHGAAVRVDRRLRRRAAREPADLRLPARALLAGHAGGRDRRPQRRGPDAGPAPAAGGHAAARARRAHALHGPPERHGAAVAGRSRRLRQHRRAGHGAGRAGAARRRAHRCGRRSTSSPCTPRSCSSRAARWTCRSRSPTPTRTAATG